MVYTVYVDGQEGTTGLRIHEYLARRQDVELLRIAPGLRKDVAERARLLNAADVAFLCLPDSAAREAVALVENPKTCIIDASTAHRTQAGWVFGLPELAPGQREAIRGSKRIANPGCHASAFILLLRPLVDAGLLPADDPVTATSITGYSGGGKSMIEAYENALGHGQAEAVEGAKEARFSLQSPRPYGLNLAHKHLPEMQAHARLTQAPVFMPIVSSFYKGLAVSVPLHLARLGTTAQALHQVYLSRYGAERFVRVMPLDDPATLAEGGFDVQGCNDTNRVDVFVFGHAERAIVMARLDNLGKGASGAAVQAMNLHLGLDEGTGL